MSDTKKNILYTAIAQFNEYGVNNVTLRTIAEELGISTGNLAYHYKNKQAIIEDAFKNMIEERKKILTGVQEIPSLEKIYNQIPPLLRLENKYLFLNLDAIHIMRNHPEFAELQRTHISKQKRYIRAVIALLEANGSMYPETIEGEYDRLAQTIWMIINFWLTQKVLREQLKADIGAEMLQKAVWELILPKMPDKSKHKFQELFKAVQKTKSSVE